MCDRLFTTKGLGKGTGFGLAIARQIVVEKHGGVLEVRSTLGCGTEFTISLLCRSLARCFSTPGEVIIQYGSVNAQTVVN
ncbi:ATP-binding protein [Microcoleus asticus]|uniref:ATP-binding protein n=1 Tax=Microcoleus asticus TaxID=2815231 RepID=UPI001553BDAB